MRESIEEVPPPKGPGDRPVVVFVHVFHADIWPEIAEALDQAFDRPFIVVLTCPDADQPLAAPRSEHLVSCRRVRVENRGRDVLPFLTALGSLDVDFEFGLKLHTKRSPHRGGDGDAWRRSIIGSLLRQDRGCIAALDLMVQGPIIGLVAPHHHLLPLRNRIVLNKRALRAIMAKTHRTIPFETLEERLFCAGTMFWFRRSAFAAFRGADLEALFVKEKAQLDGTAAHAAERLFAPLVEEEGFIATAGEAVDVLADVVRSSPSRTIGDLRDISARALRPDSNPYITGFRPFWLRHRRLFALASYTHAVMPRAVMRAVHLLVERLAARRGD